MKKYIIVSYQAENEDEATDIRVSRVEFYDDVLKCSLDEKFVLVPIQHVICIAPYMGELGQ